MYRYRVITDLDACRDLWQRAVAQESFTDRWDVRMCFQRHFQRPPLFIAAEEGPLVRGLLPLSWIAEQGCYGYFPGETWVGKTWLEQNRLLAGDEAMLEGLLALCPGPRHLRYLLPAADGATDRCEIDEIGYLFEPPRYGYDMENYWGEFSHKSAKRIRRELDAFEQRVTWRLDDASDFDRMVELNMAAFGERSYFYDERFREGFRSLMELARENGWLRMTALLVDGEAAAVDMGIVYNNHYTLVAGGADRSVQGAAKLINVYHMRRGCRERFDQLDFLCGDFSWKTLFHLTPRPLYLLSNIPHHTEHACHEESRSAACAK
ncbi:MAG: GNAT family N-acetyltransferase [Planctomycetaceae bacterium]|nr:GNAT family N-acetyltransferase [Planctomycetaceae bacterium]